MLRSRCWCGRRIFYWLIAWAWTWVCAWFFIITYPFTKGGEGFLFGFIFFHLFLSLLVLDPLNLHELMVMPILEEDYVHHQVYFLQALVHFIDLLEWPGIHFFFFSSFEEHWLASSSSLFTWASFDYHILQHLCLFACKFTIYCEEGEALGLMLLQRSWAVTFVED